MLELPEPLLRNYRQVTVLASLVLGTLLCGALFVLRATYTRSLDYTGLVWNLFLAWLPMVSSLVAYNLYRRRFSLSSLVVIGSALMWLLFFPNAPYLLTDLMHLTYPMSNVPFWYDLILFIAFSWNGFFLGLVSLYLMQTVIRRMVGPLGSWIFAVGALGAGSIGIYLGRFLRWNSWDIFTNPRSILADILERLRHPLDHLQTFGFSMLFFFFLMTTYWMVVALARFSFNEESLNPNVQEVA
jgi:uncharacterized membrane protein